mmetsp:Transcript_8861/g.54533  ORF Transcript_8861/g.54533 Transcript_8861/m.54533 type:complete len:225 (+) Transcript_8861:129-803(+)|eukprot:CAMPEP_0183825354 /NCGR_PEP_ID=MMETSP0807_2-20130328/1085_1 /TAXON_ID=88271 /ORGANISM="Picocystis salinarum, Strain CCMP1897" /LENGTH=224 /DNA_ID=CAMNT_0026070335 /DNA_START=92 /DNA_END=766 /DNA_ORIENTATION=+
MGHLIVVLDLLILLVGTTLATGRSALNGGFRQERQLSERSSAADVHVNVEDDDLCWGHPERAIYGSDCGEGEQVCQPGQQCYVSESRALALCCQEKDSWDFPSPDDAESTERDGGNPPLSGPRIPIEDLPADCVDHPIHMDVNVLCLAYIPVWFHDVEHGECRQGIYGGCQASLNNFPTRDACRDLCVLLDVDMSDAPAAEPESTTSLPPGGDAEEDALGVGSG